MASCYASFIQTTAIVGDIIDADLRWYDAVWNFTGENYATLAIYNPSGGLEASHVETDDDTGNEILSTVATVSGIWRCLIKVWDGSNWVECEHTLNVTPLGVVNCTAEFASGQAETGDTIEAGFTWINTTNTWGFYAVMRIKDPNGDIYEEWIEFTNPDGSKWLDCVADKPGIWTAEITAYSDVFNATDSDTINVTANTDITLNEAVTCLWVNGWQDHGPKVTDFALMDDVWYYLEIYRASGLLGVLIEGEIWYKAQGEEEYTLRYTGSYTVDGNYTGAAHWDYDNLGYKYGPGWGFVGCKVDGIRLGITNYFTVGDPQTHSVIGVIQPGSQYYDGPYKPSIGEGQTYAWTDDFMYISNMCGFNWLNNPVNSLTNDLLGKDYVDEVNNIYLGTDIEHDTGRPDSLSPVPGDKTDMHHWILWFNDYLEHLKTFDSGDGQNRVIMFNSCPMGGYIICVIII